MLLKVPRHRLNVFAARRGLIIGNVQYIDDNHHVNCRETIQSIAPTTALIKGKILTKVLRLLKLLIICVDVVVDSNVKAIVVVEKEATMHTLVECNSAEKLHCIFITGELHVNIDAIISVR